MITLGTGTLIDDRGTSFEVHLGVTWEPDGRWSGVIGAGLDWDELAHRELMLAVPAELGPSGHPVVSDVVVDAVLDNEIRAHGSGSYQRGRPRRRRSRALTS